MNYFTQHKIANALVVVLLLANIGLLAFIFFKSPFDSGNSHLPRGKKFGELLQEELGISEAKANEIEALTRQNHENLRPIQEEHNRLTDSLIQLVKTPNDSLAKNLAIQIGATQDALEYNTYLYFVEVRQRLDESDRLAFDAFLKKMGKGRFLGGPPRKKGEGHPGPHPH